MQNAERERLIRQMTPPPAPRAAVIAKAIACAGFIAVLVAVGIRAPENAPTEAVVASERSVPNAPLRAEAHRKQVFDARRQHAAARDFARVGQDIDRQARTAYVAP